MGKTVSTETWIDIRCPACVKLGYGASRLLLRAEGDIPETKAKLQVKCQRCKSVIQWTIGTPFTFVQVLGESQHRKVAFE